uniref:C2 domain-containing protein n=1 Tax=Ciona savignyi TaxID=51511 RepID=H2ZHP5_CIOSA
LLELAQKTFEVSNANHKAAVEKAQSQEISQRCALQFQVQKAEHLAAKDVDGTSDPYCLLAVVPSSQYVNLRHSKFTTVNTSVKESTLTPEWNENLELYIERNQIPNCSLQIQVWDCDEDSAASNGSYKKVKGVKGVGRYVKEVVSQSVMSEEKDDFMGFSSLPLSSIPSQGLERWFKLRSAHSLQKVTGRIKLHIEIHTIRSTQERERSEHKQYPVDVVLAGILTTAAETSFEEHLAKVLWNAVLPKQIDSIIQEFIGQHEIDPLTCAIVRWEVFSKIHLKSTHGIDILFIDGLLKELEAHSSDTKAVCAEKYTVDVLCESFYNFLRHESDKLARHREEFSTGKVRIGNLGLFPLLLCIKKLGGMSLYQLVRTINPTISGSSDVTDDVREALKRGTDAYYVDLYDTMLDESVEKEYDEEKASLYGALIKLADRIYRDMMLGHSIYHGVFFKILGIDYSAIVHDTVAHSFAKDAREAMYKVNKQLSVMEGAKFFLGVVPSVLQAYCSEMLINGGEVENLRSFVDWFRPTVLRWLQMSRGRTNSRLRKAVELDQVERVDEIVKHTSSALTFSNFLLYVVTFWRSLSWPDPVDAYTIALRLTDDMANALECYADLVHNKLKAVGFFDEEGQFDVTEELCLTLNNLQKVAETVGKSMFRLRHPEGPSGERVMFTFDALVNTARIGMKKKIKSVVGVVGSKIRPDIRKYLRNFANEVTKGRAIRPLMKYLQDNTITLKEWLCEPNFKRILEVLWNESLQSLHRVALVDFVDRKPYFFYLCRYVLNHYLVEFFHADGFGISKEKLNSTDEYRLLESELKMRSAKTEDLIRLFYLQVCDQERITKSSYGYLNVFASYDELNDELQVDVISANELLPLDVNGLSDPFVTLRLAPKMSFNDNGMRQTLVEKKTVNPVFNEESFTFEVAKDLAQLEGMAIIFTVLDHDVLSANDLEGEAVLPL